MEVLRFEELQAEFMERISRAVYAVLATVDGSQRPRQRIMHPLWDGPTGWMISRPDSLKAVHLRRNPAVSLAYIQDKERPVYIDGFAEWIDSEAEKLRIWELHRLTPPPLGFDPQPHYGSIAHPFFGLLRLTPRRIELGNLLSEPRIWRQPPA